MTQRFTSAADVHNYLESIPMFGRVGASAAHFALDSMLEFCERMGNPQNSFRSIHVAGTNGKGTTCQMLASVYLEAGYRVGLYTSPHLVRFHERFRVGDDTITDEQLLDFFQQFSKDLSEVPLTYFELSTAIAFWFMDRQKVDLAVIETGLGGRLDATNVIIPEVSVITSVSLDHTDILGDTIPQIAREKGGIIKPGRPVVTGRIPGEAMRVIHEMAVSVGSRVVEAGPAGLEVSPKEFTLTEGDKSVTIQRNRRKKIDLINIAVCRRVTEILQPGYPLRDAMFVSGIEKCGLRFPEHAHYQKLDDSLEWYFDGAHNREATETLIDEVMSSHSGSRNPVLVFSMMKDKVSPELLSIYRYFSTIWYIHLGLERNASCDEIRHLLPEAECYHYSDLLLLKNLEKLKTELVIFTGSFYFYSQVKKWMASLTPSED